MHFRQFRPTTVSRSIYATVFLVLLCTLFSCKKKVELEQFKFAKTNLEENSIIPKPLKVSTDGSAFALDKYTLIKDETKNDSISSVVSFFKTRMDSLINFQLNINAEPIEGKSRLIIFRDSIIKKLSDESYLLDIRRDSILVYSSSPAGSFRAVTTLQQILPKKSIDTLADRKIWPIPTGIIEDAPNFEWRGTMLDVARHFFTIDEIKKYIDHLSYYKINKLHLHLSDDQGWRIEIKSWPKLTEIGGKSEVGGGEGGYFTQEDYRELVSYAADRFITIIPEIDMPGHTNAASLSYPFLNGNGEKLKPYTGMRVGFSTFDTRKDSVYIFIDDVIREIAALTPGPYFHIGGDESHVTKKNDYNFFVEKVEKIVNKNGKIMIGWDEIATANINNTSISQFWRNEENAKLAEENGMKIILSPGKKAYLDMKYNDDSEYGLTWAGMIPIDSAYNWNPSTYLKDITSENILGIEAPLWSETISNLKELEYLAFPRIIGYAELGWSIPQNRNWEDYKKRLLDQQTYLDINNVNFYKSQLIEWTD